MPKLLKPDQISMLRTDGYVAPIPVFSKNEAAGFRRSLEALEQSMTDESKEETMATLSKFKPHLLFTWLDKICHNETLLNAIEDLIGPDILIYSSAFFIKNSNDQAYVPWHQDSIYAHFKGGKHVRAWVAFTDSNTTNGCLRVIKGSHKKQFKHIEEPSDANNILFRKEKISEDVDEELAADLILKPGEMSVHDYGVIHGSEPNSSNDRRIGFAIAFVTPDTIATGRHETAMLARGYASEKDWELEPRPLMDRDNNARLAHARAMKIREGHFYNTAGAGAG